MSSIKEKNTVALTTVLQQSYTLYGIQKELLHVRVHEDGSS